jgi:aspartyl-tRNA(Asn)/glutamyl-tRNA(Gln) amidotransferase subunit A
VDERDLCYRGIAELAAELAAGRLSPVELTEATLRRIERLDPLLNAYLAVMADSALEQARQAERELRSGQARGPLHGMPVALKDLIDVVGTPTTAGSSLRRSAMPRQDATITARLRAAGAVLIGKTNLHECAYGVTSSNPHFGPVRNPWNPAMIPGGSSGGSGAAVAAGLCAAAIGSDTGGSIRIPAALCGIVGLKPTYGRVSRAGVVPLAWSLDHLGPMTRTVADAALLLGALAGADARDASSAAVPATDWAAGLDGGLAGLRIGVPRAYFWEELAPEVEAAATAALATLRAAGAVVEEVVLPGIDDAMAAQQIISLAEASAYHEPDITGRPDAFGADVRERLQIGLTLRAVDYLHAQRVRSQAIQAVRALLRRVDLLVTPATAAVAAPIDGADANLLRAAMTRCSAPFNLTGLPALALPCGFTAAGLPVGLQLVGRAFDEATVLRAGHAFEAAAGVAGRRPPVD